MRLVNQNKYVGVGQRLPHVLDRRLKLVDYRRNHGIAFALEQLHQMSARSGIHHLAPALLEGVGNLAVEVGAVGHHHDSRARYLPQLGYGLGQQHHGERLAAPLRVPHHAALALAVVESPHPRNNLLDREILLIAGQLLDAPVVDRKVVNEVEQPLRTAEAEEIAVLLGGQHPLLCQRLEVGPHIAEAVAKQVVHLRLAQRLVYQAVQLPGILLPVALVHKHLAPLGPEFGRSPRRAIGPEAGAYAQQQGAVQIERADTVVLLVAQMLRDSLVYRPLDVGALALDYHQRDTVHKQHDVGPIGVGHAGAGHRKLLGHMIHVPLRPLPVDKAHGVALLVTVDALLKSLAQRQQVIHRLVAAQVTALHGDVAHGQHPVLDVLLREKLLLVAVHPDGVDAPQLVAQHLFEQHVRRLAAAHRQRLVGGQIGIAQLLQQHQGRQLTDMVFLK